MKAGRIDEQLVREEKRFAHYRAHYCPDADAYHEQAESIRADILQKMWDVESAFFYDLHHETDEKAQVKNIVGFYPAWAQVIDGEHDALIAFE